MERSENYENKKGKEREVHEERGREKETARRCVVCPCVRAGEALRVAAESLASRSFALSTRGRQAGRQAVLV